MSDKENSDNKQLATSKITPIELFKVKKQELSIVESSFKDRVTKHAAYVDKLGNASTGAKGLYLQINTRIAKAFGTTRDQFTLEITLLLISLLNRINQLIDDGERQLKPRPHIKKEIYKTIEDYGRLVGTFYE